MTKRKISESVFSGAIWDFMSDLSYGAKVSDLIARLNEVVETIPVEYRGSAEIEIESEGGYEGEHHVEISIRYTRPEGKD